MTMYTVKTTKSEADAINKGDKAFCFRADEGKFAVGNNIAFIVADNQRIAKHPIEDKIYKITCIDRGDPISDGVIAIGFIRIA